VQSASTQLPEMSKNKLYRKQLEGHRQALAEHLEQISQERKKFLSQRQFGLSSFTPPGIQNFRLMDYLCDSKQPSESVLTDFCCEPG
jgi:hypothetical protein